MANIKEWAKGITFFVFVTLMFYFLWSNVFSNIIEFVGTDIFSIGNATDIAIMKSLAWVSFIMIYLSIGLGFLIYSIMVGASGKVETQPLYLLAGLGMWSILMPFSVCLFGITYMLQTTLESATNTIMDTSSITMASTFTWKLYLIALLFTTAIPFVFIIKGYGVEIMGESKQNEI